ADRSLDGPRVRGGARTAFDSIQDVSTCFQIERPSPLGQLLRDHLAMLHSAVRAELQLRADVGDGEPDATDASEQPAVLVVARLDRRVPALGLEMRELPLEDGGHP